VLLRVRWALWGRDPHSYRDRSRWMAGRVLGHEIAGEVAERLKELATIHHKSLPQMAIACVLGNPAVPVHLVGMQDEHELQENLTAVN